LVRVQPGELDLSAANQMNIDSEVHPVARQAQAKVQADSVSELLERRAATLRELYDELLAHSELYFWNTPSPASCSSRSTETGGGASLAKRGSGCGRGSSASTGHTPSSCACFSEASPSGCSRTSGREPPEQGRIRRPALRRAARSSKGCLVIGPRLELRLDLAPELPHLRRDPALA
jgi:hypothetical protein